MKTRTNTRTWVLTLFILFGVMGPEPHGPLAAETLTDKGIAVAVDDELAEDPATLSTNIDITAVEGIVTLTGHVPNILAKNRARELASTVKGVRAVVNRIEVRPLYRSDMEIRDEVRDALLLDPVTESWTLDVSVAGGVVTLGGSVDSWQEKQLAARVAQGVRGVRDIENRIDIDYESDRTDAEIQEEIEAALRWDAYVDDSLIDVSVNDGTVTFDGIVGSHAEKTRAYAKGWVAGVRSVDDSALEVERWARDEQLRTDKYVARSDSEIRDAVKDALLYDPRIYSFKVDVESQNGYVTLRGTVDNLQAKRAAAQDTRSVVGVWAVDNKIKVRPSSPSDPKVEANVENSLMRDPYVDRYEIDVSVFGGHVYLYGDVTSTFEKARADHIAGRQNGVVDVHNLLTVSDRSAEIYRPYVDAWYLYDFDWYGTPERTFHKADWEIKRDIENELFWSPFVDSGDVSVEVNDGVATLIGIVDTWSEREAARENALEGGAVIVDNDLTVEHGPGDPLQ